MLKIRKGMLLAAAFFLLCSYANAAKYLIPGGSTIGIRADVSGLIVTGIEPGLPAGRGGIKEGDILLKVNGSPLHSVRELTLAAQNDEVSLTLERNGARKIVTLQPQEKSGEKKLGVLVRDHVAGIGTVTYYDPEDRSFGALGHGIADPAGQELIPITGGVIVESSVTDVVKGKSGTAGQLSGSFQTDHIQGTLRTNTEHGVFGSMNAPGNEAIPVAERDEIHPGAARIYSNVDGKTVQSFSIEIVKVYEERRTEGRDMLLRVTDPELLEKTGGIVQGMSGSPIIQDGKLVGAVTHVLVNTPESGYGVCLETMLKAAKKEIPLAA